MGSGVWAIGRDSVGAGGIGNEREFKGDGALDGGHEEGGVQGVLFGLRIW